MLDNLNPRECELKVGDIVRIKSIPMTRTAELTPEICNTIEIYSNDDLSSNSQLPMASILDIKEGGIEFGLMYLTHYGTFQYRSSLVLVKRQTIDTTDTTENYIDIKTILRRQT